MNSAAAVLTAYHKGDQEALQTAFQSWKVANENAIKAANMQEQTYQRILAHTDRERGQNLQEQSIEHRDIAAKMAAAVRWEFSLPSA